MHENLEKIAFAKELCHPEIGLTGIQVGGIMMAPFYQDDFCHTKIHYLPYAQCTNTVCISESFGWPYIIE